MSKYIVKSCPNLTTSYYAEGDIIHNQCGLTDDDLCQDCIDCKMKQIVELCNGIKCPCEYKGADCWECAESGARRFADKILKLLDIQEVL